MEDIEKKMLSIVPEAKEIKINITGGYGSLLTGNVEFTTDKLDGKFFSVGIVVYSDTPLNYSLTSSKKEIKDNLSKFK